VLYGAFLGLDLWIIAWERRLLFSVPVLVITPCFGEVGLGGFGFHIWDGVIRECRVDLSNVPVLTHRIYRVRWFFLSLRDSQSFLYFVYDLTWVVSSVPLGSGGIRGVRLCSDKRRITRLPLVDNGFVRISPWEGCKPGLDVSLWSVGLNWCHACLFTYILKLFSDLDGVMLEFLVLDFGCAILSSSLIKVSINKGLGYKMDSEYKVLVQVCRMLMKYKDFCLKIGPSLLSAEELQVIFFCWIECMVQLVIG
ncbi:hypothetical protein Tco_1363905, partial [Tanacetum coccineum]